MKQTGRWTDDEIALIKSNFAGDGDKLLYQIRDVMFQVSSKPIRLKKDVIALLYKLYLPDIDGSLPFGLQASMRNVLLSKDCDIRNIPPEVAYLQIKANDLAIEYVQQRLDILSGKTVEDEISYKGLKEEGTKTRDERYITMLTYLFLANNYLEGGLQNFHTFANTKEKTPEEISEEQKKDSSK